MPFSLASDLIRAASSVVTVTLMDGLLAIMNQPKGVNEGGTKQLT